MKKTNFFKLAGCILCCFIVLTLPINTMAASISLKLGHVAPPNTIYDVSANKFAERVAANTEGKAEVKVFGFSKFGNTQQHWSQVKSGAIDIFFTGASYGFMVEPEPKNFQVMMAPYVFDTQEELHTFLKTDLFRSMMDKVEAAANVKYIGYMGDRPARGLTTTNREVTTPEDLKGLKIRTGRSSLDVQVWKDWGASPTAISARELYTSLKSGLVEGQDNPILAVRDAKYYEVQKYYIYLDRIRSGLGGFMNQDNWNSLPEDVQAGILKAAGETAAYVNQYVLEQLPLAEKECEEYGMIILRPDLTPFKELAEKTARKFDGELWEQGMMDKVRAAVQTAK